ncbi:amidase, partial [Candidatus Bipolaricaulota bacterium]|nr:amidase [Candidatus Bipolaricaulota bacterium]
MMDGGIRELQDAMGRGALTAQTLVEQLCERIDAVDRAGPKLNSVLELNPDAMEIAEALDRERCERGPRGLLHGIPVMVKANVDTADRMTTTAGSLALAGSIAPRDAFLVKRLREAGAIILAKTNLSEWANFRGKRSISGWSSQGGQTRNPHDPTRSPCGSSSGSAVAIAAGLSPVAVGTETDGSIVCPAQTCGIVGIKPTIGLVSRSGIIPIAHSQDTAGPMARSVDDAAILLSALAGRDPRDPATQAGSADFSALPSLDDLAGVRLGIARNYFGNHRDVDRVIEACIELLADLGATIVDSADIETAGKWRDGEMEVLLYEFKHDLNAYLTALGPAAPVHSLAEIVAFNEEHADEVMPHFGQELMEMAEAKGPLSDPTYLDA